MAFLEDEINYGIGKRDVKYNYIVSGSYYGDNVGNDFIDFGEAKDPNKFLVEMVRIESYDDIVPQRNTRCRYTMTPTGIRFQDDDVDSFNYYTVIINEYW